MIRLPHLAAFLALLPLAPLSAAQSKKGPPNVVLVYADDMGWGDLGVQNPESKIPTPNLDRLASEGLRCTDAHSSSGICTPSRFALLTGTHHWRRFHGIANVFGPSVFREGDVTMASMLKARGYDTACIGKWHLGWDWNAVKREGAKPVKGKGFAPGDFDWEKSIPDGPTAWGFDYYFGDDVPNFPPYTWLENDRVVTAPTLPLKVDPKPAEGSAESRPGPMAEGWRQDMVMPRLTARVEQWLKEDARKQTPFFLYFPWTSPHAPITPAVEFKGSTEAGGYGDFLHQSDAHLGRVLKALREQGLADNTIVIFTADNGPEHYAYPRTRDFGHRSTGPLRGLKRDIFEGGHRVPFLVRWPGVIEAGRVSDGLVGQVDLFRTIAAVCGAEVPDGAAVDSVDQLAVWQGKEESPRTFHIHNTYKDRWAVRRGDWLYVNAKDGAHSRVPEWYRKAEGFGANPLDGMLFNLGEDLGQRINVLAEHGDVADTLRALLESERARK